ncbi:MAG: hypothetical protein AMXMBFR13_24910 [Phycisphaerae bacterium]
MQLISRPLLVLMTGITLIALIGTVSAQVQPDPPLRWFKGNTHTHTWWSDGDSPPETAVAWYKEHGYNFLVLSDHNILSEGEKWVAVDKGGRVTAAETYEKTFGPHWVEKRERDGKTEYRLKTLTEFRALFEEAGKFLLIQGEEISDSFEKKPVHVNGINLKEVIKPPGGATMFDTMQNNINAVLEQQKRTGQPMFPHLNHPNFHWANPVEDIMRLRGERFFEAYNGHPSVNNYGDAERLSTERMWDIILTHRISELGLPMMLGLATDDAHGYTKWGTGTANPGRGWVVVRSRYLTPTHIVEAMERGDFYASTGVELEDVTFQNETLSIRIRARSGETYKTQFIGTLEDYKDQPAGEERPGDRYSPHIGKVLAESAGTSASYTMTGRELYVRAKVISSAPHPNPYKAGDPQVAWVQPVQPKARVSTAQK